MSDPRELPTGRDYEVPERPPLVEELLSAFGHLLDQKLSPLVPLPGQVARFEESLRVASGVFEAAAQEFGAFAETQSKRLEALEARLRIAESELSSLRAEVASLRSGGSA